MQKLLENKAFKIIYGIIRTFIVSFLVIYLLFVIIQRVTNNSSIFGYRMFTVATGSMEPVYNVNDVILVKDTDPSTLKVGDDIAYLGNRDAVKGLVVTHRIIRIETLGKVLGKVYVVNFINHVVKNIYGFFFLVFCPLVLVIFLEIADTIIEAKVEKNELRLIEKEDKKKKTKGVEEISEEEDII